MKKFFIVCLLASLLLIACGRNSFDLMANGKAPNHEKGVSGPTGFITAIEGKRVLIGDIFYTTNKDTIIIDSDGNRFLFSDLELGMKVQPFHSGEIRESFPAQADAVELKIFVDETSQKESIAVSAMLKDALDRYEKPLILKKFHFSPEKNAYEMELFSFTHGSKLLKYMYYVDEAKLEEIK